MVGFVFAGSVQYPNDEVDSPSSLMILNRPS